jgi:nucleoside-diphosphate-sugar epimerase
MYGAAEGGPRQETDTVNPLTAYARSKNAVEESLKKMDLGSMTVTCLRFATACGMSARLRLDLVLNDFVAGAITAREISVLSDGSPWRPLIDVRDMCRAIDWAATRKQSNGGQLLHLNAGSDSWNFQVRDLARAVAEVIPGTKVRINPDAPPDKRSYRVSFARFKDLAPHHQPTVTLEDTIRGLRDGLESMGFDNKAFRSSSLMRLKVLEQHIESRALNSELYWTHSN